MKKNLVCFIIFNSYVNKYKLKKWETKNHLKFKVFYTQREQSNF